MPEAGVNKLLIGNPFFKQKDVTNMCDVYPLLREFLSQIC